MLRLLTASLLATAALLIPATANADVDLGGAITLRVDDIRAALDHLRSRGVRLIDDAPRPGAEGRVRRGSSPAGATRLLGRRL